MNLGRISEPVVLVLLDSASFDKDPDQALYRSDSYRNPITLMYYIVSLSKESEKNRYSKIKAVGDWPRFGCKRSTYLTALPPET